MTNSLWINCPKCSNIVYLPPCPNCGRFDYTYGTIVPENLPGLICTSCYNGIRLVACQHCGCMIDIRIFVQKYLQEKKDTKKCFIATEIYGENSPELNLFKIWRDNHLLKIPLGSIFIKLYYCTSPILVMILQLIPILKKPTREILAHTILKYLKKKH